ncbi:hypothetical protein FBZ96_1011003 [Bradyrhizobium stylosanthis]|uniref:Uncharacterized protein n=1 Tax=Bradyrhizobium stylosanthis TaxID=1803665 RepID=A0A560ED28_9BRAD|nr:hypothetical protein FBZ96_1011003 [Bradyrhizobium stylosanthis]
MLSGCITSRRPLLGLNDLSLSEEAALLNPLVGRPGVGNFYYLSRGKVASILDLRARLAPRPTASWYETKLLKSDGDEREVAHVQFEGEFGNRKVAVSARGSQKLIERLTDPFAYLEVLNRPATGELYNRTAEQRLATWKASLADVISRSAVEDTGFLALCTIREEFKQVDWIVNAHPGDLDDRSISRIQYSVASALGLVSGGPAREVRGLTIGVVFQRVALVTSGESPSIQFSLGNETSIIVSGA